MSDENNMVPIDDIPKDSKFSAEKENHNCTINGKWVELTGVEMRVCTFPDIMASWQHLYELYSDFADLTDDELKELRTEITNHIDDAIAFLNIACAITDDDVAKYIED